jgi:hypothetical protein
MMENNLENENPARNADGTLKDVIEIKFLNSPSDNHPLCKMSHTATTDDDNSGNESPSTQARVIKSLKGKLPTEIVAGKRIRKASSKAKVQLGMTSRNFFASGFTLNGVQCLILLRGSFRINQIVFYLSY